MSWYLPSLLPAVLLRSTLCSAPFNFFFNFLSVRHPSTRLSINRRILFLCVSSRLPCELRLTHARRTKMIDCRLAVMMNDPHHAIRPGLSGLNSNSCDCRWPHKKRAKLKIKLWWA
jgi:hypothetical protein